MIKVMFRVDKKDKELYALFPEESSTPNPCMCLCYAQIGQHCSADPWACIARSRPATEEEYAPLLSTLKNYGHEYENLEVIQRTPLNALEKRKAQIKECRKGYD